MLPLLFLATLALTPAPDPFTPLSVYNGSWTVHAAHPWSGAPAGSTDRLDSHCTHHIAYFSCEQIVNAKPAMLIVYVPGDAPGQFHTKDIYPNGLSANRGDLTISGEHSDHFSYLDKGENAGKPTLARTENYFKGPDAIHFEEYESTDDGKSWTKTNEGEETRIKT